MTHSRLLFAQIPVSVCMTGSFTTVPSKGLPGDESELTAAFIQSQIRVVKKRAGSEKKKITGDGGGGGLGVAQVVLGVSIEGSRGSRICGGRAARWGLGEIS